MKYILAALIACLAFDASAAGATFRIVTDEPADDFVVACVRSKDYLIAHNASSYSEIYNVVVVSSNQNGSCGLLLSGRHTRLEVYHPTYVQDSTEAGSVEDRSANGGVDHIVHMTPSLTRLQELEQQYASGYWNQRKDPLGSFLERAEYACGFEGHTAKRYLDLYSKHGKPDYPKLKARYADKTLACLKSREAIRHKYGRSAPQFYVDSGHYPCARLDSKSCSNAQYRPDLALQKQMDYAWGETLWGPHLGSEEERNRAFGKKTYLVVLNDPKGGGTWFLIDAYSKAQIKRKYPDFVAYDDKPNWMTDSQKTRFVKNCDGTDLHWDIDKPTGWLLDYEKGVIKDISCNR